MYVMTSSGKLFSDQLTEWLLEAGFIQSQCQISIYYKYALDGTNIFVLSYLDDCVYWYTSETIGKWFLDTLGKIFHMNFLGYEHWFMSIQISQMKDHSISVDQARYGTSIVAQYLDTITVKTSTNIYKITLSSDMISTKADAYTSDDQVEKLTRELNIHCRSCIVSLIYLLSKRVDFSFAVHKLARFSANPGKVHYQGLVYVLIYIRYNRTLGLNYYSDMKYTPLSDLFRQDNIKTDNQLMDFYNFIWKGC